MLRMEIVAAHHKLMEKNKSLGRACDAQITDLLQNLAQVSLKLKSVF